MKKVKIITVIALAAGLMACSTEDKEPRAYNAQMEKYGCYLDEDEIEYLRSICEEGGNYNGMSSKEKAEKVEACTDKWYKIGCNSKKVCPTNKGKKLTDPSFVVYLEEINAYCGS
jgi:hypothetical protein